MLVRILFSVLLIASCSMQAMESAISISASSSANPSFVRFLAQAKKARYGKYAHELSYFFLHADDESNGFKTDNEPDEFRKDISNLVYKMTSVSAQSSPVFTGKVCQGGLTSDSKKKIDIFDSKVRHTVVLPDGSSVHTTNRDYTKLACGGVNFAVDMYIVDVATGTVDHKITYPAYVVSAQFNHAGTKLVVVSIDKNIYVADVATGTIEHVIANPQDHFFRAREVNPDGTKLALPYSADKNVRVFSTITGKELYRISCEVSEPEGKSIEFNHDSTILTVRCEGNKTRTFDLANHRSIINTLSIDESFLLKAFEQAIQSESCIHADDAQWETWESLKATLNGGYEKPDSLAVQRLTPYIMKQAVGEESLAEAE